MVSHMPRRCADGWTRNAGRPGPTVSSSGNLAIAHAVGSGVRYDGLLGEKRSTIQPDKVEERTMTPGRHNAPKVVI